MLRWEDFLNIVHHHLWERRGAKCAARVRRRLERWRDRAKTDGRPDLLPQARTPKETRMSDVETPTIAPAALGRLFLSKVDAETAQALRAALTVELLDLVRAEAVHEARVQLEAEYADTRERLYDALEVERQQMHKDCMAVADAEWTKQLAVEQETYAAHLDEVRTKLRDMRERAHAAEAAVTAMLTELCGGLDATPVWLYSGGHGLRTLHKGAVNAILGRGGVQLRSKTSVSARKVVVRLDDGKTAEHTQFWLTKAPVPGVVDPEDTEED